MPMSSLDSLVAALALPATPDRLLEALTHRSFVNENPGAHDYEQLEFLGDAVLGLCVSEMLLAQVPHAREGALTRMRADLVRTETLAEFAASVDLARHVRLGKGAAATGDALQPKLLADIVEAIVAAVYLQSGLQAASALTRSIVAAKLLDHIGGRDPKSALQELVQARGSPPPVYRVANAQGPSNHRVFDVDVLVDGVVTGTGRGKSKKIAERHAAACALQNLNKRESSP